jgi:hypothetical protein
MSESSELVVLEHEMWSEVEVEWMAVDGMEGVAGDAGYGIELETPVADSKWNSAP